MQSFAERLRAIAAQNNSLVCVGLDPNVERLPTALRERFSADPAGVLVEFTQAIIAATADLVCAYKPNLGFYLAYGLPGMQALAQLPQLVPATVPIILDAKVNDLRTTAVAYAQGYFDTFGFDAVTLNPYLGADGLEPFLRDRHRGVFILSRTSNPSAPELQDLPVTFAGSPAQPLYQAVARQVGVWIEQFDAAGQCGVVTGATYPADIAAVRQILPTAPLLIPGVGEQGGSIEDCVRAGVDADGFGVLINASRSITYASHGTDYAQAARQATEQMRAAINAVRQPTGAAQTH